MTSTALIDPGRRARPDVVLSIRACSPTTPDRWFELAPGRRTTFGLCGCGACQVDIRFEGVRIGSARLTGALSAHHDHWRLSNLSRTEVLVCEDLEDSAQRIRLLPGRAEATIPFELSRVRFSSLPDLELVVLGHEPPVAVEACAAVAPDPLVLREGSACQAVLEALCAARRHGRDGGQGGPGDRLPSSAEISRRLTAEGRVLSRRAVDHHIDYLSRRLGLVSDTAGISLRGRREALVDEAIRRGLVSVANPRHPWTA